MVYGEKIKIDMIQRACIFCKKETHTLINAQDNDSYEEKVYDVYFCIECDVAFIPFCDLPENLNENYETIGYYSEFDEKIKNSQKASEILLFLEKIFYKKRLNFYPFNSSKIINILIIYCTFPRDANMCNIFFPLTIRLFKSFCFICDILLFLLILSIIFIMVII